MRASNKPLIFLDPFPRTEEMVFSDDARAALEDVGEVVTHFGSRAPADLVEQLLPEIEIIIGQTDMPEERLERAPLLKAILNVKANWEPNIDYAGAQARGIYVLSAAPAMAPAVAEAALGFAIALGRRMHLADRDFRAGGERYGIAGNRGDYSLYDAPVGLVGFGNLGRALVPLLKPFGCRIAAYDPWLSPGYLHSYGVEASSLDALLSTSRFLFILAGTTAENEGFLNRGKLELISPDASVILISRAEVVDFDALVELAEAGRFRAAIDVFPEEPVPEAAPVRAAERVLLSAHRAGGIADSYKRIRDAMVEDVRQILAGHPPLAMQRAEPRQAAMSRSR